MGEGDEEAGPAASPVNYAPWPKDLYTLAAVCPDVEPATVCHLSCYLSALALIINWALLHPFSLILALATSQRCARPLWLPARKSKPLSSLANNLINLILLISVHYTSTMVCRYNALLDLRLHMHGKKLAHLPCSARHSTTHQTSCCWVKLAGTNIITTERSP